MFAGQGPEAYVNVFEKKEESSEDQIFQPESQAEFDAMFRQMRAEGMPVD